MQKEYKEIRVRFSPEAYERFCNFAETHDITPSALIKAITMDWLQSREAMGAQGSFLEIFKAFQEEQEKK